MMKIEFLSDAEVMDLSPKKKIEFYERLKVHCFDVKKKMRKGTVLARDFVCAVYPPIVRRYDYRIEGKENIPENGKALFMCNHSNSHDFFTPLEVLRSLGLESTVFAASDDLDIGTRGIFAACNAVLADRRDKQSTNDGIFKFCSKMLGRDGVPGWMYGEATWNMHPYRAMQNLKRGGVLMAAITGLPIIPTIIEYVEKDEILEHESELYKECVVKFGYPFYVDRNLSLISQTLELQRIMETLRIRLKASMNTAKYSLRDVDTNIYLNHTYLKKFDGFGYTYDSASEQRFLFSKDGHLVDNEYKLSDKGILVPGATSKEEGKRFLPKRKG